MLFQLNLAKKEIFKTSQIFKYDPYFHLMLAQKNCKLAKICKV